MKTSPTHMATPGAGGRYRELPDGSLEPVPEDAELAAPPAKKPKAPKRQEAKTAAKRPAPGAAVPALPKAPPEPPKTAAKEPVPLTDDKETAHD